MAGIVYVVPGDDEVEVVAEEGRGLGEAFPEVGDQVHDAAAAVVEEFHSTLGLIDRQAEDGLACRGAGGRKRRLGGRG